MPKAQHRISVIMPVYNGAKYLRDSVRSILNQSFESFELLMMDDGSTDESMEIVRSFDDSRIVIHRRKKNKGLTYTLNEGLTLASAPYIARQDADDIALPDRFRKQVAVLDSSQHIDLVGSWVELIDEHGSTVGIRKYPSNEITCEWHLLFNNATAHSAVLFRREAAKRANGYDPNVKCAQDFDLWSRMTRNGQMLNIPEVLERYRVHEESITIRQAEDSTNTGDRIAAGNQAFALNKQEPDIAMAARTRGNLDVKNFSEGKEVLQHLAALRKGFASSRQLTRKERVAIQASIASEIDRLLMQLPVVPRICLALTCSASIPRHFWLSRSVLKLPLSSSLRERLGRLMSKVHK